VLAFDEREQAMMTVSPCTVSLLSGRRKIVFGRCRALRVSWGHRQLAGSRVETIVLLFVLSVGIH
jgi:hypothetical protein